MWSNYTDVPYTNFSWAILILNKYAFYSYLFLELLYTAILHSIHMDLEFFCVRAWERVVRIPSRVLMLIYTDAVNTISQIDWLSLLAHCEHHQPAHCAHYTSRLVCSLFTPQTCPLCTLHISTCVLTIHTTYLTTVHTTYLHLCAPYSHHIPDHCAHYKSLLVCSLRANEHHQPAHCAQYTSQFVRSLCTPQNRPLCMHTNHLYLCTQNYQNLCFHCAQKYVFSFVHTVHVAHLELSKQRTHLSFCANYLCIRQFRTG
jgi:hypothetical protein